MDGNGRLPPGCNRIDGITRPGDGVSSRKDTLPRGLTGDGVHLHCSPLRQLDPRLRGNKGQIRSLADGGNNRIDFDPELRALDGNRPPPSRCVGLSQSHPETPYFNPPLSFGNNPARGREILDLDSLREGFFDLLLVGGHLLPGPPVQDGYFLRANPQGRPGGIYRHIAAPDDRHPLPYLHLLTRVDLSQKGHSRNHPLAILAGDVQPEIPVGPGRYEDSLKPLGEDVLNGYILSNGCIRLDFDTEAPNVLDLRIQDLPGKTVFGNTRAQHSPGGWKFFEDRYPISLQGQVVGRTQSSGP